MIAREVYLREVESQLSRLDREIYLLKLRVEEAPPEVMAKCYRYVSELRAQHGDSQAQFQAFEEAAEEACYELYSTVDSKLRELNECFQSVAPWIYLQLGSSGWFRG